MKKVLIINPFLYTSEGKEKKTNSIQDTIIVTLCKGFVNNGWMPTLIADMHYKPTDYNELPFEVVYFQDRLTTLFSPYKLPFPKGLYFYVKKHAKEYDMIITSEVFSLYSLMAVLAEPKKTIVWHEMAIHNRMWNGCASKIWYGLIGRLVFGNVRIAPRSQRAKSFISQYCHNVSDAIFQHSVDENKFRECKTEKKDYFVSVSQLIGRKHVEKIIDKFADFQLQHYGYKLYICGDGDKAPELKQKTSALGLQNNIIFTGNLSHDKLSGLMASSKGLLVYTERDNSILTISESIVCGTPVITTSVPDNSFIITENELGICKDNWGAEELEKCVIYNRYYSDNCKKYRYKLINTYIADLFIRTFGDNNENINNRSCI